MRLRHRDLGGFRRKRARNEKGEKGKGGGGGEGGARGGGGRGGRGRGGGRERGTRSSEEHDREIVEEAESRWQQRWIERRVYLLDPMRYVSKIDEEIVGMRARSLPGKNVDDRGIDGGQLREIEQRRIGDGYTKTLARFRADLDRLMVRTRRSRRKLSTILELRSRELVRGDQDPGRIFGEEGFNGVASATEEIGDGDVVRDPRTRADSSTTAYARYRQRTGRDSRDRSRFSIKLGRCRVQLMDRSMVSLSFREIDANRDGEEREEKRREREEENEYTFLRKNYLFSRTFAV